MYVDADICLAELRNELAGYQGYPPTVEGEKRFARALKDSCVSVGHVRAVLGKFTERFPTVQQIIDTALNLQAQFLPSEDETAQWERQYGKPQPAVFEGASSGQQEQAEMWVKLRAHFASQNGGAFPGFAKLSWTKIYCAMRELGYPLTPQQEDIAGRG